MRDNGYPTALVNRTNGRRTLASLLVVGVLTMAGATAFAHSGAISTRSEDVNAAATVYLAGADNESLNKAVQQRLNTRLGPEVHLQRYSDSPSPGSLIVALGNARLKEIRANHPRQPVLAFFVSESDFAAGEHQAPQTAIYHNPPLLRQARLGQLIIPRATKIALLASPDRVSTYETLLPTLLGEGLDARLFVVPDEGALIRTLGRALVFGDFLLGTNDDAVFNRNTIKHLLLTSYRQNRVLIGPTRSFVRAGAVASTYTSINDQIDEGVQLIRTFLVEGFLPEARYPSTFSVEVNSQVARSLNLPLPSERALENALKELEGRDND